MTEKVFKHAIFEIAHPLVQNLIEQVVLSRKFSLVFPAFYNFICNRRADIEIWLSRELLVYVKKYYESNNVGELNADGIDIDNEVLTIINVRNLMDGALWFIQKGEVQVYDHYLLHNKIMTSNEIERLYQVISNRFWEHYEDFLLKSIATPKEQLPIFKASIVSYLDDHQLYLSSIVPSWTLKQLLVAFLPIYLTYEKYNNTKNESSAMPVTKLPTYEECKNILEPLFIFNMPVKMAHKSFIDYTPYHQGQILTKYMGLVLSFDEAPENLSFILRDFLIKYTSGKIDYLTSGTTKLPKKSEQELSNLSSNLTNLISLLDGLSSRKDANQILTKITEYSSTLNAIIALLYFDEAYADMYDLQYSLDFDAYQCLKYLSDKKNIVDDVLMRDAKRHLEQFKRRKKKQYELSLFMEKLKNLASFSPKINVISYRRAKNPISTLTCSLKEEKRNKSTAQSLSHSFYFDTLKQTIPNTLKKLAPEFEEYIEL